MMEWFLIYLLAAMPISVWVMTHLHLRHQDVTTIDFAWILIKSVVPLVREVVILMMLLDTVEDRVLFKRKS
jgi:hypothetical protein